jgi:photosystem II stability/assembly factor-like uncharacterized protein
MKSARVPLCFLIVLALFAIPAAPVPAADLSTWHLRNMSLNSAASGNGIYIAVGEYGFMMRSTDGDTWTKVSSGVEDELSDVAYGNGVFVAVGGNTILVSSDGLTWNEQTPPAGFYSYNITFGNGSFVAINSTSSAFVSSDGINWTERTLPPSSTLTDIIFGYGQFMVVGYSGTVITAPAADLSTWTPRTSGTTQTLRQVAYRSTPTDLFVAVGASGTVITSTNAGLNWTVQPSGITQTIMAVGYGNGLFVASGGASSSDAGHIWTSTNGIAWTEQASPAYEWFQDVLYAGSNYFIIGGKIITSTNGTAWSIVHGGTGWDIWSVAYGNGVYAAGTLTGDIIISPDGIRWTQPTTYPDVTTIVDMAYCPTNQRFVGGISNGLIYSVSNGVTWNSHAFVPAEDLYGLYYVHDRFIGTCANGNLILSPYGITWSDYSTASLQGLRGATYGNNTFVVVGYTGTVVTSQDDGATWQVQLAVTNNHLNSVAYGNGTFVAAGGFNQDVITSPDGINWTHRIGILPNQTCYSIVFYDDVFLAIGSNGSVYSSSDGTVWSLVNTPATSTLFCGTADGPGVTMVGLNGAIIQLEPPPGSGGGGGSSSSGGCFISSMVR